MEKEIFISGYCRCLDQSRMVAVVTEEGKLTEADCAFGNCPHEPNCLIAKQIRELAKE